MEFQILFILTFSIGWISGQWLGHAGHEYYYSPLHGVDQMTWFEARAYCMNHGGDLVSLTTPEEEEFVQGITKGHAFKGGVWNGLNNLDSKDPVWKWSDGQTTDSFVSWDSNFPIADKLGGHCGYQTARSASGNWKNGRCNKKKAFVCKRSEGNIRAKAATPAVEGYCPAGYKGVPNSNKCFKLVTDVPVTWHEAGGACRAGPGHLPNLANIADADEQALITSQMQQIPHSVWIGLYKEYSSDTAFKWVDNSPVNYLNWGQNEPSGGDELCVEAWNHDNGLWNDVPCERTRGYACETYKQTGHEIFETPNPPKTCPETYTGFWYGCYKKHAAAQSWDAAKQTCQNEGANLVSIMAGAENAAIQLGGTDADVAMWIGGKDEKGTLEYGWVDGWNFPYSNWGPSEPSISSGCILFHPDGKWSANDCTLHHPFMCKYTDAPPVTTPAIGTGTCPGEFGWHEYGDHCYYFEEYIPGGWKDARARCTDVHANLQLASIHSEAEMNFIYDIVKDISNPYLYDFWFGLYRSVQDQHWRWDDGTPVDYEHWSPDEPNGDAATQGCVEMFQYNGLWNDHTCTDPQYSVCKMARIQDSTTTPQEGTTPVAGECPEGWEEFATSCYLFKPDVQYQAKEAQSYCRSQGGPEANLVSIDSIDENLHIFNRMKNLSHLPVDPHGYWIGYQKDGLDSPFYWLDGCVTGFTNWAYGEPNDSDGQSTNVECYWNTMEWNDHFPNRPQGLVCELHLTPCFDGTAKWRPYHGDEWYISHVVEETELTWHQARDWCMQNGGDLASFRSAEEQSDITNWMGENQIFDINMWHGFNSLAAKNNEQFAWADETTIGYTKWAEGYPATDNNGHYCTYQPSKATDQWYNAHCDDNNGFICRRQTGSTDPQTPGPTPVYSGYCPPGYIGIGEKGNKCYKIVYGGDNGRGLTWNDAMNECRSAVGGLRPDLASIVDQFQMSLIMSQLKNKTFGFWIGGQRGSETTPWKWVNNDPWQFENWDNGYPDSNTMHHCAEMKVIDIGRPGRWANQNCDNQKGYICEIYKGGSQPDPPPTEVTCEEGFTPYWYGCYSLLKDTRAWAQANEHCEEQRTTLPSIHSYAENAAVHIMVLRSGNPVWIGLKNWDGTGDYKWIDEWHVVFTNWGDGEPSDPDATGGCVSMHDDGKWYDDPCDNMYSVPCKSTEFDPLNTPAPLEGECPDPINGVEWVEYGSYCYYFDTQSTHMSWTRGQELCRSWHQEANLVSIHDHLENEFVAKQFVAAGAYQSVWIGYHRQRAGQEFSWVDRSTNNFQKFAQGEPNGLDIEGQECVEMYPSGGFSGLWNDHGCTEARHVGCKMPKLPAVTTPPHTGGDCDEFWQSYGSNCYLFMPDDHLSWDTAQQTCLDKRSGSNLASVESFGENKWMVERMEEATHYPKLYNYWIGMKLDRSSSDVESGDLRFTWVDGTEARYHNWGDGEPNNMDDQEDCVEVSMEIGDKGSWNDIGCKHGFGYACKYPKVIETAGSDSGGMSGGTVAGIVFGVIFGVLALGVVVVLGLSYMGVINGPIAARQSTSGSSGGGSKGTSSGFGFSNNIYENADEVGGADITGDSVAYHADTDA